MNSFRSQLTDRLSNCFGSISNPFPFRENAGVIRRVRSKIKAGIMQVASKAGFVWLPKPKAAMQELNFIFEHCSDFERLSQGFSDQASRNLLIEVLCLRVLGPYSIKSPIASDEYWRKDKEVEKSYLKSKGTIRLPGYPACNYYELPRDKSTLKCHASHFGIMTTFISEQYKYLNGDVLVAPRCGDVVIDGGGYLGETGLYFAEQVGETGKVFTFEFNETSLRALRKNYELNAELSKVITIVPKGIWHTSGEKINYSQHGPGTTLKNGNVDDSVCATALTTSFDDFVNEFKLDRLDYIKMDIEGAELAALQGGKNTLKRFRPSLAIALYHNIRDFIEIPDYLRSLDVGYRFYLKHAYVDQTETVLFAVAR